MIVHSVSELKLRELVLETMGEALNIETGGEYQVLFDSMEKCDSY